MSEIGLHQSELIIGLHLHVLMGEARPTDVSGAEVVRIPLPAAFERRAAEMKIVVPGREIASDGGPRFAEGDRARSHLVRGSRDRG